MPNIDPKYLFWSCIAVAVSVMLGCVVLLVTGNGGTDNANLKLLETIGLALIGACIAGITQKSHQDNIENQEKIADRVGADLSVPTQEKKL